ncbi:4-hydroxythreonine-4-phosphate dehydrogenase PdxA [Xylanibacillus composti]|uniref:4-hydroxythreonine-4-phosphate dehydrogenase n=1 Tax=Xylanibacillus composti TaxID=1572762 RepID=A0A8J4M3A0_9BACL|nr:4-hydroxythreonine-4-phosphate dehydrogenase PdxA [Xylanibacillus composti]MDT9724524.1 4-hydroxythreonine-4-phosphate dehydrogenase PdxA [Xylanibacillus composti]GIQ69787.1 4-hydroxythreonine-4-phosphate dehydrogenase [Xylanibacillus composti]
MSNARKPVIGITMGDAAGIGPEIIVKSLHDEGLYDQCKPIVIGDAKRLKQAARIVGLPLVIEAVERVSEGKYVYGTIDCLDLNLLPEDIPFGEISGRNGDAAFQYVKRAVELTLGGELEAICTAPLSKEALHMGGHLYPGHTEILAALSGTKDYAMLLSTSDLHVIHVTTHIGLLDAIRKITPERVYTTIRIAHETLLRMGVAEPKIGVCGINPHAGENGLFGYGEEEEKIAPAIRRTVSEGMNAAGPLPADTLFFRARRGDFDMVVAMYHDQGHGPVKVLGLEAGVNMTAGLPFVRTSVDHGTAFDIAGKGVADELSMKEAIRQAIRMIE